MNSPHNHLDHRMRMARRILTAMLLVLPWRASAQDDDGYELTRTSVGGTAVSFVGPNGLAVDGTVGQPEAGVMSGGEFSVSGGFWAGSAPAPTAVSIVSANPPLDNPFLLGAQPFRDVLQTGTTSLVTQGIGAAGTPNQATVTYSAISVTFSGTPSPSPSIGNIIVECNGSGPYACPMVTSVAGSGTGPYTLALSGPIPPLKCTTLTFAGTSDGQRLQYQSLPGDLNYSGSVSASDISNLVIAINNGQAAVPANLPRYDVNRSGTAATADLLRLVQLLNGVNTTQAWTGTSVAACP